VSDKLTDRQRIAVMGIESLLSLLIEQTGGVDIERHASGNGFIASAGDYTEGGATLYEALRAVARVLEGK
jgi:hypothetical protein